MGKRKKSFIGLAPVANQTKLFSLLTDYFPLFDINMGENISAQQFLTPRIRKRVKTKFGRIGSKSGETKTPRYLL
jgi:hypothetical protein